jgi:hypothetical protein
LLVIHTYYRVSPSCLLLLLLRFGLTCSCAYCAFWLGVWSGFIVNFWTNILQNGLSHLVVGSLRHVVLCFLHFYWCGIFSFQHLHHTACLTCISFFKHLKSPPFMILNLCKIHLWSFFLMLMGPLYSMTGEYCLSINSKLATVC